MIKLAGELNADDRNEISEAVAEIILLTHKEGTKIMVMNGLPDEISRQVFSEN